MLFLFFASFYISHRARARVDYTLSVVFLTIAVSLFSTVVANAVRIPYVYPFGILSFPFFSTVDWAWTSPPLEEYISSYNIQFLTVKIWSLHPNIRPPWDVFYSFLAFYFFVNAVGATLGYWMNKRLVDEPLKRELFDFFFHKALISISALYIINVITLLTIPNDLSVYVNLFSVYFFWAPAIIATLVYGIHKFKKRLQSLVKADESHSRS